MEVRTVEHKDIERTVAPEEVVSVNFIEAITVSYTHLDVYKRQGLFIP